MSLAELTQALKQKTLIYGTTQTLRKLKQGKLNKIFIAANCPDATQKTIAYYAQFKKIEVVQLEQPGDELALICKRNHPITVLSY